MRRGPKRLLSCQRPLILSHCPILPLARSIAGNDIGDEGATALAATLKDTKITDLECAATPESSLLCQRPLTRLFLSSRLCPSLASLCRNRIGTEGVTALAAILNETQITNLECAAPTKRLLSCQRPLTLPFPHLCSLRDNALCGVKLGSLRYPSVYTTEGITKLCEGIRGSAVTSLRCAFPRVFDVCQRPLTLLSTASAPVLAVCASTTSVPREEALSRRASRATRRCKCSSRPPGDRTGPKCSPFCQRPG